MNPIINKKDFDDLATNLKDLAYSYIEKYSPSKQQLKIYLLKKYLTKFSGTKSKKEITEIIDQIFQQYSQYSNVDISLELIAVFFGLLSVWFSKNNNVLVYPTGIINTSIFVYLLVKWELLGDMIINVKKGKKLTNMRTQGTDENVVLTPVRKMSIAEQLSMLNTDEALEITPESCRLRKAILDPHERKKSEKSGAAA